MELTLLDQAIDQYAARDRRMPASAQALKRMAVAAPLPPPLRALYERDQTLFAPGFEQFEAAIYEDVNGDRESFGHLAEMVFFADDQAGGFYFADPGDLLGLGPEFIYWTDRGLMEVDEVVPLAEDLPAFLIWARTGVSAATLPSLGQRALSRLRAAIAEAPGSVEIGPPVDPLAIRAAREDHGLMLTFATGDILAMANGMAFTDTGREVFSLGRITAVAGGYVAVVGHDPVMGHLGVTLGGWQNLPPDRVLAFADLDHPERGKLLGRMADVLTFWIKETEQ